MIIRVRLARPFTCPLTTRKRFIVQSLLDVFSPLWHGTAEPTRANSLEVDGVKQRRDGLRDENFEFGEDGWKSGMVQAGKKCERRDKLHSRMRRRELSRFCEE
jgi:hypothetical protein